METKEASKIVQAFFRVIPYPFCYPFVYRLFSFQKVKEEQRQKIEAHMKEGAREFIEVIDGELKKYGKRSA